ncbi:ABC transporter ATP-binding protein [Anaerococcus degeneri]|uniref:ATP-binding cassette domain-containing protein n=1 Tax=Anaerococcus degeneri TaxID=361500 RepID=A0ABS7YYC8_9FIRM|nr:ATP-binding cassette domain-containing protein [Anaerococcus degeneri]MBP2015622.1 ABC-2 type transport system ATP-binding protein [Anaerococcus degeneri]MCA2095983.1 ATP-binding cassette domain-containing protein [Anaerococcus degeneri]
MIEIKNLSKNFADLRALDNVSFEVEKGELFGVIGQNGAGKSTLFRSMMNFYDHFDGEILYEGKPMANIPLEKIGFLPEERSLSPKKTIREEVKFFARLNQMSNLDEKTLQAYFDRFEIKGTLDDKIKSLSKGNQQKVQLLASLIYKPEFLILDEPFSGLDPYNANLLMGIIKEINEEGTTIIFSSHNMENVEYLCDRLIMLKNGKIVLKGSPDEIRNSYEKDLVKVRTEANLSEIFREYDLKREGSLWTIRLENEADGREIFARLSEKLGYLEMFSQEPPSLNEIFARKVEEDE